MGLVRDGDESETFIATEHRAERGQGHEQRSASVAGTDLPNERADAVIVGRGVASLDARQAGRYLTLMWTTTSGSLNARTARGRHLHERHQGVRRPRHQDVAPRRTAAPADEEGRAAVVMLQRHRGHAAGAPDSPSLYAQNRWALEVKEWSQLATFYHQVVMLYNGIFGSRHGRLRHRHLQRGQHDRDVDLRATREIGT